MDGDSGKPRAALAVLAAAGRAAAAAEGVAGKSFDALSEMAAAGDAEAAQELRLLEAGITAAMRELTGFDAAASMGVRKLHSALHILEMPGIPSVAIPNLTMIINSDLLKAFANLRDCFPDEQVENALGGIYENVEGTILHPARATIGHCDAERASANIQQSFASFCGDGDFINGLSLGLVGVGWRIADVAAYGETGFAA